MDDASRGALQMAMYAVEQHTNDRAVFTRDAARHLSEALAEDGVSTVDFLGESITQVLKVCAQQEIAIYDLQAKLAQG